MSVSTHSSAAAASLANFTTFTIRSGRNGRSHTQVSGAREIALSATMVPWPSGRAPPGGMKPVPFQTDHPGAKRNGRGERARSAPKLKPWSNMTRLVCSPAKRSPAKPPFASAEALMSASAAARVPKTGGRSPPGAQCPSPAIAGSAPALMPLARKAPMYSRACSSLSARSATIKRGRATLIASSSGGGLGSRPGRSVNSGRLKSKEGLPTTSTGLMATPNSRVMLSASRPGSSAA